MSSVNLGNENFSKLSNTVLSASALLGALSNEDLSGIVAVGMQQTAPAIILEDGDNLLSNDQLLQAANGGLALDGSLQTTTADLDLGPDTQANARALANLMGLSEPGHARLINMIVIKEAASVQVINLKNSSGATHEYVEIEKNGASSSNTNELSNGSINNKDGRVIVSLGSDDNISFNILG